MKGPGLRYEGVFSIFGSHICWVNRRFLCVTFSDVVMNRRYLKWKVSITEHIVADDGNSDYKWAQENESAPDIAMMVHYSIQAKQENVNELLNNRNVVKFHFRHDHRIQSFCFHAVEKIAQVCIKHESTLRYIY